MRPLRSAWSVVLLTLAGLAVARADEVYLRDGRVLDGEVVSQPGEEVMRLRRGSGSLVVTQHFPAADVDHVVYGKSDRQRRVEAILADRARLGDGGDAAQWWDLALRARDVGDTGLARELAQQVVLRDRQHLPARRLLGMVQVKGVWMRSNEAAVAQGQMLENGRWITWKEHEEQVAAEARQREQAVARRKAAEELRSRSGGEYVPYPATELGSSGQIYVSPGYPLVPRVVTWPSTCGPSVVGGTAIAGYGTTVIDGNGLVIHGGGRSGGSAWSFHWGW